MGVKYLRIFATEFSNLKEYKLDFFLEYLGIPIRIMLLSMLWYFVFLSSGKETIGGMNFPVFLIYIGMASFIGHAMPGWEASEKISTFILDGNILMIITKPVRFIQLWLARESAGFLTKGALGVIAFVLIASIWHQPTILNLFLFFLAYIFGMILNFMVMFTISLFAFFIYAMWGLRHLEESLRYFFTGEMIPLSLFPGWLSVIADWLPYKYMMFGPIFIYLGKFNTFESIQIIFFQIGFLIFFTIISKILYSIGLKKTDSHGG